ncbi:MAG: hypothetical protein LBQ89_07925 [Treponema sp.]|nr:hypothetical protein [Treponema sp.]
MSKNETPEEKSRFEEIAKEIISPIMDKVCEVAFDYIEQYKSDSDVSIRIPIGVKEGVLEKLCDVADYLQDRASYYKSASLIGFALGKDGDAPGRRFEEMADIAVALCGLIEARDSQIKSELAGAEKRINQEMTAKILGF